MKLDARSFKDLIDAAHHAWSNGDVEGVLAQYADDLTFWSNVGGADEKPLTVVGKPAMRAFLQALAGETEGTAATEYFRYSGGLGRAKIEYYVRHKQTGLILTGSYRQITSFRDGKILRVEQYHDAARTAAFWRLIMREMEMASG